MANVYEFRLKGQSSLLQHQDNIDGMELVQAWRKDPKNKTLCVPGDDRSPAWTWQTYLYRDEEYVAVDSSQVMVALRSAGAQMAMPNGRSGKTFKTATQYGIIPSSEFFDLKVHKERVPLAPINELWGEVDYAKHVETAEEHGFKLFKKRARVGMSKHVRVRPRFDSWVVTGRLVVTEPTITADVLRELLRIAGERVGIGDWRPSSASAGQFGRFDADIERVS